MKKIQIALILILAINVVVLGQSNLYKSENKEESPTPTEWKSLTNEKFEIQYPSDWVVDQSGQMGISFFLFSPLSDESDNFKENVNLLIQDLAGYDLTLDGFVDLSENQIKTLATDGEIILSDRIKDDKVEHL